MVFVIYNYSILSNNLKKNFFPMWSRKCLTFIASQYIRLIRRIFDVRKAFNNSFNIAFFLLFQMMYSFFFLRLKLFVFWYTLLGLLTSRHSVYIYLCVTIFSHIYTWSRALHLAFKNVFYVIFLYARIKTYRQCKNRILLFPGSNHYLLVLLYLQFWQLEVLQRDSW